MTRYGRLMRRPNPAFAFGANLHRALEFFHTAGGAERLSPDEFRHALEQPLERRRLRDRRSRARRSSSMGTRWRANTTKRRRRSPRKPSCCSRSGRCGAIWDATSSQGASIASMNTPTARWRLSTTKAGAPRSTKSRCATTSHCTAMPCCCRRFTPTARCGLPSTPLRPNKKVAVPLDAETLAEFRDLLDALVAQILNEDWDLLAPRWIPYCAGCEFLELCVRAFGA
jgi:hypothetical protein